MVSLTSLSENSPLKVLCLGAHSDDIEIGCGGTILKWLGARRGEVRVRWVVFSASAEREAEAAGSAAAFLREAKQKEVTLLKFEDGFFPYQGLDIKRYMHRLSREFSPDLIFTHYGQDLHQDHRLLSELTWNAFRDHWILEYEIPKYDGDLGAPNVFVPLPELACRSKLDHLFRYFQSQRSKSWFTEETFVALHRLRGIECRSASGYAEAFYGRKIVL
ncbi:MAG TPA: PIG-L deacetylase family protein [Candidatus Eisenbacteria bacterium]|nr:PIG-L deacetylase family protein [Candidatus Eisenbacteria bacterium]